MSKTGWVKKHRRVLGSPLHQDPLDYWLFDTLIMLATFFDYAQPWRGQLIPIKRGQAWTTVRYLTSLQNLATKSTIARRLKRLEKAGRISVKSGTSGMIITILNYDKYQPSLPTSGTPESKKRDYIKNKEKKLSNTPPRPQPNSARLAACGRRAPDTRPNHGPKNAPFPRGNPRLHNMSYAAARHELERQLEALKRIQNREAAEKARLTDEIQSTNVQAVLAEARRIRLRGFDLKSPFFCQRANPDLPNESNA